MKKVKKAIDYDTNHMGHLYMFLVRQDLVCRQTHGRALPSELAPFYDQLNQLVSQQLLVVLLVLLSVQFTEKVMYLYYTSVCTVTKDVDLLIDAYNIFN